MNALKFYNSIFGFMLGFINIQNYRDFRENIQNLIIIGISVQDDKKKTTSNGRLAKG